MIAANRPEIYPEDADFETDDITILVPYDSDTIEVKPVFSAINDKSRNSSDIPEIVINNLGLSVARNIFFTWKYDVQKVTEQIKSFYNSDLYDIESKTSIRLNYLKTDKTAMIPLPEYFMRSCGHQLNNIISEDGDSTKVPLELDVQWWDLYGQHYWRKFNVLVYGFDSMLKIKFQPQIKKGMPWTFLK